MEDRQGVRMEFISLSSWFQADEGPGYRFRSSLSKPGISSFRIGAGRIDLIVTAATTGAAAAVVSDSIHLEELAGVPTGPSVGGPDAFRNVVSSWTERVR